MKKLFTLSAIILSTLTATAQAVADNTLSAFSELCKKHIYTDFKQMYKPPIGGVLKYPFITPGSQGYANVLWDWDSWLSDVALQQILQDRGTASDKAEALPYEQGCILNYLHEYYNPETGEPIMNKGFQNWNFLVLNMIAWLEGRKAVVEF